MNLEALVVGSAGVVAFDHARRSASQPRALQDTAVRDESPLSPDHSGRAGAVSSAYLRGTGSTDKSPGHRGPNAEVHLHPTLKEALEDAESAFKECIANEKWEPYNPALPQF